ncbi:hypothetical protein GZ77_18325 [Endozoicomonas montiporae]|uniref:Uncharacterized protein n=2 Tax=Endozoicomonas montiporae TaxID=1027273 RepID=A0A081N205_9GAMM|nr:porin [Endozoicomonas montiporae]AMO58570.1 porin [Endozoicomonas montiporae CL-33]KEQ12478.1 hypothetical protein GZ77_18325 [Endozoicomonas montiporae]
MQKKLLATVVASLVAGQAMALEVYNDDTTSLSIGGRIGVTTNDDNKEMGNDSSRINFKFGHKLSSELTAIGVAEWSFDPTAKSGENVFGNRLGYVGLDHSELGALTAGKQWSVYSDVANWASDNLLFNGGIAIGIYDGLNGDGGIHGTGRADDAFAYRNTFGGLNIGLQYQLKSSDTRTLKDADQIDYFQQWNRKTGASQIAVSYDLPMGLSVGYTYSQARFNKTTQGDTKPDHINHAGDSAKAHVFGVKFDHEDLYVGFNYGEFKHHASLKSGLIAEKAKATDLYASYALSSLVDGLAVFGAYQNLDFDKDASGAKTKEELKIASIGVKYQTGPMMFGVQYDQNDSKNAAGKKENDNIFSFNARYYF